MRIRKIRKRSGGVRTIYVPSRREKWLLRSCIPRLVELQEEHCPAGVVHGFYRGRSAVTNALFHVGYRFTMCFDLADFFDTVTPENTPQLKHEGVWHKGKWGTQGYHAYDLLFPDGAARQGLPTSPFAANISASAMDRELEAYAHESGVTYTRYADDLTFSWTNARPGGCADVQTIVERHGYRLNHTKTRLQDARCGRRIITGVAVGESDIYPTRRVKRKLRAALHQQHKERAEGLAQWCRLPLPKRYVEEDQRGRQKFDEAYSSVF